MAALDDLLAALDVTRRPGRFTYLDGRLDGAAAVIDEPEGPCSVVETADGGWAWLTLGVSSPLEAVGLTAAVATVLAGQDIACNVLAGLRHDHLIVPVDLADDAVAALRGLSASARRG